MKCPKCGKRINIGRLLGSIRSPAKANASRINGAKGGRPRKGPRTHVARVRMVPGTYEGQSAVLASAPVTPGAK